MKRIFYFNIKYYDENRNEMDSTTTFVEREVSGTLKEDKDTAYSIVDSEANEHRLEIEANDVEVILADYQEIEG